MGELGVRRPPRAIPRFFVPGSAPQDRTEARELLGARGAPLASAEGSLHLVNERE